MAATKTNTLIANATLAELAELEEAIKARVNEILVESSKSIRNSLNLDSWVKFAVKGEETWKKVKSIHLNYLVVFSDETDSKKYKVVQYKDVMETSQEAPAKK